MRVFIVFVDEFAFMETLRLLKYLACAASRKEEESVEEWLASDTDGSRRKQYREAHLIYDGMTLYDNTAEQEIPVRRPNVFRIVAGSLAAAAAAAAIAVGGARFGRQSAVRSLSTEMRTVSVPAGRSLEMALEDGTKLWLNSGTTLEYPVVFPDDSRNIRLVEGEAMFDVARDASRPFTVSTFASDITVTGTRFNVRADEQEGSFSAALLSGEIRLRSNIGNKEEYILKPNDIVTMLDGRLYVGKIQDPGSVDCWTKGLINISGVPFDELMRQFETSFGVNIVIERDSLPQIRYTRGKVRVSDGIDHALSMLKLVSDFTYVKDERTNTVTIR